MKILQFGPISGCSNVVFDFSLSKNWPNIEYFHIPVDAVAKWLIRSYNYGAINSISQKHTEEKERILKILTTGYFSYDYFKIMINILEGGQLNNVKFLWNK